MATGNSRDVELRVRATDVSGKKTFNDVAKSIKGVTDSLDDQIAMAKKGEVSAKELASTLTKLKNANADLLKQQSVVDLYERLSRELETAEQRALDTATAARAQRDAVQGAAQATREQTRDLKKLETAERNAEKAARDASLRLAVQEDTLRALGLEYDDLAAAQAKIANSSREVGTAYRATEIVLDNYHATLRELKATEASMADSAAIEKAAADAQRLREASAYVRMMTDALQQMNAEERKVALAMGQDRGNAALGRKQEATAVTELTSALDGLARKQRDLEQAERTAATDRQARFQQMQSVYMRRITEEVAAEQKRDAELASLNAFRKVGSDAEAAAIKLRAYGGAASATAGPTSTLAAGLRAILNPSAEAVKTLDGLEAKVAEVSATVGNADKPIRDYQAAINDLDRIQGAILRQASAIDAFERQKAAVQSSEAAYRAAKAEVLAYAQVVQTADEPNEQMAASLKKAEGALESATRDVELQRDKLQELRGALTAAGIASNDTAVDMGRLRAAASTTAGAIDKLNTAQSGRNTRTGRFLGLRPYELQNLSYQLNDVFTQIASGTSITQTFAQQGGQFVQLFPRMFAGLKDPRVLAAIIAITVTLGPLIAALKNLSDFAASERQFAGQLRASADAANYNATSLAEVAHELDVYGGKLKVAREALKAFMAEGIDDTQLERFGRTAENMARVLGGDVPDAAQQLAEGLSGGYDQVVKLNEATNVLTAAEQAYIRELFESGQAARGRTEAFRIFEERLDAGAEKTRGPWSRAVRSLTNAWDSFVTSIGNSAPIQAALEILEDLASAAERAAAALPGAGGGSRPVDRNGTGRGGFANGQEAEDFVKGLLARNGIVATRTSGYRTPEQNRGARGVPNSRHTRGRDVGGLARDFVLTINGRPATPAEYARAAQIVAQSGRFVETRGDNHGTGLHLHTGYDTSQAANPEVGRLQAQQQRLLTQRRQAQQPRSSTSSFNGPGRYRGPPIAQIDRDLARVQARLAEIQQSSADTVAATSARQTTADAEHLKALRTEAALRDKSKHDLRISEAGRLARLEAGNKKLSDGAIIESGRIAEAAERAKIEKEIADEAKKNADKAEADRKRAASEEAARLARLKSATDALANDVRQLETNVQRSRGGSLEERLAASRQAVDTQFSDSAIKVREARAAGVGGDVIANYEQRMAAGKVILQQQAELQTYEEVIGDLEDQRADRLERINNEYVAGRINAAEAFRQSSEVTSELAPQIASVADRAKAFAESIRGAVPDPRLEAFIANMAQTGTGARETGRANAPLAAVGRDLVTAEEAKLNAIISARNDLVSTYNDLTGVAGRTASDTVRDTGAAFAEAQPKIDAVVASIRALLAASGQTMTPEALAAINARLSTFSAPAQAAQAGQAQIVTQERELNRLIGERQERVSAYNRLVESGAKTQAEGQELVRQAYTESQPLIEAQVDAVKTLLDTQLALGTITPQVYDMWLARLQAIGAEAQHVDENFTRIREGLDQAFISSATAAFDSATQAIGNLIAGTATWEQTIQSLGQAALQFGASFLKQLSDILLQMFLLQAIQKLPIFDSLAKKGSSIFNVAPMLVAAPLMSKAGGDIKAGANTTLVAAAALTLAATQMKEAAQQAAAAASLQLAAAAAGAAHGGAKIGPGPLNMQKTGLSPYVFAGAPRYHTGTVVGLAPDEQAAILQHGEEVLNKHDPRNIRNGGASAHTPPQSPGGAGAIRNVLIMDPRELAAALQTKEGEQLVLTHVKANAQGIRQMLGVKG